MGEKWNRTSTILTVWRAGFIRTEPASHLLKLYGGRFWKQKQETPKNGFDQGALAHGRQRKTAGLLQLTFVCGLLVACFH